MYILVRCVTGNICNTLDMTPGGVKPTPQKREIAEYPENY
jgi:hypothetical protein